MPEPKTLGDVAKAAYDADIFSTSALDKARLWDSVAAAVVKSHEERKWMPIETAPKDGTRILLWWLDSPEVGYFVSSEIRSEYGYTVIAGWHMQNGNMRRTDPTHWQSLPEAPNA